MDPLDDIIGQDTAKKFIRTAIKKRSLYNLFLNGPRGVGKRSFAFAVAQMLGCAPESVNLMVIGAIPSKIKDKPDKIEDYMKQYLPENQIVQMEDRAMILIEQIRNLIEMLATLPPAGSKRVVIIIEADRMTDEAANCFLKTLEEPPTDTLFILTSSRPDHVIPTIQSRCQSVPFIYLQEAQIGQMLLEDGNQYRLGSPGEIIALQSNEHLIVAKEIFDASPLNTKKAAEIARKYDSGNIVDVLYSLLLLYRMTYYQKLNISAERKSSITKKSSQINILQTINAISRLNKAIITLERYPNRLLLMLDVLTHLP